jgi:hypothetical protein
VTTGWAGHHLEAGPDFPSGHSRAGDRRRSSSREREDVTLQLEDSLISGQRAAILAVLLVASTSEVQFGGLILMWFRRLVGEQALSGASVLTAVAAVVIASMNGVRHLRKLITQQNFRPGARRCASGTVSGAGSGLSW